MKQTLQIFLAAFLLPLTVAAQTVIINEVDADNPSTDDMEFIELFDGGSGNTPLDGMTLVLYNGSDDASYQAFDLDGMTTSATGYFVLCGNAAMVPNCDMDVGIATNLIQNGTDAVALVMGDAVAFPNDTPITAANVIDAIVYDTNDDDDAALLILLNAGQPQVNEGGNGDKDNHSNQRVPNGSGGARNTDTYTQLAPSPGTSNGGGIANETEYTIPVSIVLDQNYPNPFNPTTSISFSLPEAQHVRLTVTDLTGREVAQLLNGVQAVGFHRVEFDAKELPSGMYLYRLESGGNVITKKMILLK